MKILTIHSDSIEIVPKKKAIKDAQELKIDKLKEDECLVVFTASEKIDESNPKAVAERLAKESIDIAEQVKTNKIVLYPYVHLTNKPSNPKVANEILDEAASILKKKKYTVTQAPFGWYKAFKISCKGHPLSELSREFGPEEEEKVVSLPKKFLILTPDGKDHDINTYKCKTKEFKSLVEKEALKADLRGTDGEPPFIHLCKKLLQIEWEPMSDKGHMRYGPVGAMVFDLVADRAAQVSASIGASMIKIKGTNMFNMKEKAVSEHANLYGDRLYFISVDKDQFVLRYAACHQQFAMAKDWQISYKHLPLAMWENADSYRYEQSGETVLCFRLRRFFMPDTHIFCKDIDDAKKWFVRTQDVMFNEIKMLGRDYEFMINVSSETEYKKNKTWLASLLKKYNKPALITIYPPGKNYYWTINIEYNIIDDMDRPREISTVQIDIGNAQRFGITYTDEDGKKRYPVILHTAPVGGIERYIYTVIDTLVKEEKAGKHPVLPLWLAPTQLRICPVSDKFLKDAEKLADKLEKENIRIDIDDRNESISKKVSESERDWIQYTLVYGEREKKAKKLPIRIRTENKVKELSESELVKLIKKQVGGFPFRSLPYPQAVSRRPIFN